jgi:GTP pyrophosphokinase
MAGKKKLTGNMRTKSRELLLGGVFQEGRQFAAQLYAGERRKVSGRPYMKHLEEVADLVREYGGNIHEIVAALFHDAVEDQRVTLREVHRRFGENAARIVDGCTPPNDPGATWKQRKAASLARLHDASPSAHLVKAADALDNARSLLQEYRALGDQVWVRFNGSLREIQWYYRRLADLLRTRVPHRLGDELERAVSEIERIAGGIGCGRGRSRSGKA